MGLNSNRNTMSDSLKEFQDALYNNRKAKTPSFPDAYRPKRKSKSSPANELTSNIVSHLNLNNQWGTRINSMGRIVNGKYIPGSTQKGMSDIVACVDGLFVALEIKIGKDRQSDEQKNVEAEITRAGGHYYIVKSFDDYLIIYSKLTK